MIVGVVFFEGSVRKIPVQYANRQAGQKGSDIPVKLNSASVIPVIFASTLMSIPMTIIGVLGLSTLIVNLIYTKYKTYPFHLGSTVRRQIVGQRVMINDLERNSVKLEQLLAKKTKKARKLRIPLDNVSIIRKYSRKTNAELLDYVYAENDYFYQRNRRLLGFMHFAFVVAILSVAAVCAVLIVL